MKKIILISALSSLAGCATTENFYSLQPSPLATYGQWSGAHKDISVATVQLNKDGTGVICQDFKGVAKLSAIKKIDGKIYTQDGSYWRIKEFNSEKLTLAYGAGGSYFLTKDDSGNNISPECKIKLIK
ncbi:J517_1871 family lipoprotein [Acinetobacter baumannii]|uniref:J517_1871 family lipoprotein n=1 Tax=Acinetobacter baumannii TaxID=470 RepID=UPI00054C6A87|nr:J517_1871 family lipoprotein [Acinetobacter baumannii]EJG9762807.1 hypothetical protein [Acinetobacter baumannii]EKJ2604303.1 hypothetical protein [Acinetobacter baumannii]EKT7938763.1 hypothetical protein [Acinetobacter baumannii]EKT7950027.1 hypothetical protein [Acinetobacter baumannii]EKT8011036.1 hypothetical protein [Acinetobacter baumannii]